MTPQTARSVGLLWMSLWPSYVCVTNKLATCLPMPYSSLTALPPKISCSLWSLLSLDLCTVCHGGTYLRALTNARSQFCLLIMDIISGAARPSSLSRPTWVAAKMP